MHIHDSQLDFGELRSLLHQPASRLHWGHLCALIEQWAGSPHMIPAIDYANQLLMQWPSHYRTAPVHWTLEVCRSHHVLPQWGLVRSLDLNDSLLGHVPLDHMTDLLAPLDELNLDGQSPRAVRFISALLHDTLPFSTLSLHRWGTSPTRLTRQLARAQFSRLRTLRIADSRLDDEALEALLVAPWLSHIERIEFPHNLLHDGCVQRMIARLPRLTHLNLTGNQLSLDGVRALLHSTHDPPIHTLLLNHNASPSPSCSHALFRTPLNSLHGVRDKNS